MPPTDPRALPLAKLIDLPPLWLILFIALARLQAVRWPIWPVDLPLVDLIAGVMVGAGVLLAVLAILEMRKSQTTIVPHLEPGALVTSGVFSRSRNPIYLGDALILCGLILFWKAWPSLVLVPLFMWLITDRFIRPEEARLRARFGARFDSWAQRVRRWV
ncbi:MAG: isoprenylcysteine carboxylmethyltransferase family protein [Pseudomonadota bacterium]